MLTETQTQLPLEVQPDARSALRVSASGTRVALVRAVEQDVKRLTRATNKAKKAAALALQESAISEAEESSEAPSTPVYLAARCQPRACQ